MDGWNTTFLLGRPIFRCELLVSGSVPSPSTPQTLRVPGSPNVVRCSTKGSALACQATPEKTVPVFFEGEIGCLFFPKSDVPFTVLLTVFYSSFVYQSYSPFTSVFHLKVIVAIMQQQQQQQQQQQKEHDISQPFHPYVF